MSALVRTFRGYLDQTLGRAGAAAVFTDHQLDANTLLTPELAARARGAAVLLVVLSPGYLASGWCQGELRQFLEQEAGRRRGRGTTAVVVVERDRVDPGDDPAATRDHLRTQFWEADPDSLRARPLGFPLPTPGDRKYHDKVLDLARAVAAELKRQRAAPPGAPPPPDAFDDVPPRPVAAEPEPQPPPAAPAPPPPAPDPEYWKAHDLPLLVLVACADDALGRRLEQYARNYDRGLPVFEQHEGEPYEHLFASTPAQAFLVEWRCVPAAALRDEVDRFFGRGRTRLLVVVSDTLAAPAGPGRYAPTAATADLRDRFLPRAGYYAGLVALVPGEAARTPDVDRTLDARALNRDALWDAVAKVADGLRLKAPPGRGHGFREGESVVVRPAATRDDLRGCLQLRHLIYDSMGYLNDHVSGCPARLEVDRFDGFNHNSGRGTLHLVARLRHRVGDQEVVDQDVVGAARLVFARRIPDPGRVTVLGADPTAVLERQARLIREVLDDLRAEGDEKSAAVLEAQTARTGFGSLPILQSTDFEANNRTILREAGDMAELSRVVVAPQFRGCGLSRLLVRAAVAVAIDLRKKLLLLECVPGHVAMYRKLGFEAIEGCHTRAQDLDQKAVAMMIRPQEEEGRLEAVVRNDLAMLALRPGGAPAAPYLCLCDDKGCWSNGRYESRTKQTCPLRPRPGPARPAAV